jgi:hypothetical protein
LTITGIVDEYETPKKHEKIRREKVAFVVLSLGALKARCR